MKIIGLQISEIQTIETQGSGEWWDKTWTTGFFKLPAEGPQWLGYEGLESDEQSDRKNHGGADKAICVYSTKHDAHWSSIIEDYGPGAFGENLRVEGLDEENVRVGDIYQVGEAIVQVSQPRQPCWKLARRWKIKDLTKQVEQTGFTGFYFRVLQHGLIEVGQEIKLIEQGEAKWTLAKCNELMHHNRKNLAEIEELANYQLLSANWKDSFLKRLRAV